MEGEYDHIVNTVRNPNLPNPFPEMSTVQQRASIRMSSAKTSATSRVNGER
jgi:hypothetical protein